MIQSCPVLHWTPNGQKLPLLCGKICDKFGQNVVTLGAPQRQTSTLLKSMDAKMDTKKLPNKSPKGNWVQTERSAHEAWALLIDKSPKAAKLMHILTSRIGDNNAVVVSQKTLEKLMGVSRRTVQRAVKTLEEERWIELRKIGESGTVNAHVINDRVAWSGKRDGIRYSLFSAAVIVSDEEQSDKDQLGQQAALRKLPKIGEFQFPAGDGLPPPSQKFLDGMEPNLPEAGQIKLETNEKLVKGDDGNFYILTTHYSMNMNGSINGQTFTQTRLTSEEIGRRRM